MHSNKRKVDEIFEIQSPPGPGAFHYSLSTPQAGSNPIALQLANPLLSYSGVIVHMHKEQL